MDEIAAVKEEDNPTPKQVLEAYRCFIGVESIKLRPAKEGDDG